MSDLQSLSSALAQFMATREAGPSALEQKNATLGYLLDHLPEATVNLMRRAYEAKIIAPMIAAAGRPVTALEIGQWRKALADQYLPETVAEDLLAALAQALAIEFPLKTTDCKLLDNRHLNNSPQPNPLHSAKSNLPVRELTGHKGTGGIYALVLSPDGRTLASSSSDDTIILWDVMSGQHLRTFQDHESDVIGIAWSPDGRALASVTYCYSDVRIFETSTGRLMHTSHRSSFAKWIDTSEYAQFAVAWSTDGLVIASGDDTGRIELWHANTGKHCRTLIFPNLPYGVGYVTLLSWSPDGRILAAVDGRLDAKIHLYDRDAGKLIKVLECPYTIMSIAWAQDGHSFAAGMDNSLEGGANRIPIPNILFWNSRTWQLLNAVNQPLPQFKALSWSNLAGSKATLAHWCWSLDGRFAASAFSSLAHYSVLAQRDPSWLPKDKGIYIWETDSAKLLKFLDCQSQVYSLVWLPDGKTLLAGCEDNIVRIYQVF